MKNEPVAWMGIRRHGETRVSVEKLDKDDIALYIHPVKELTDEEIKDVYFNTFNWNFSESVSSPFLDFARAILRKAQE